MSWVYVDGHANALLARIANSLVVGVEEVTPRSDAVASDHELETPTANQPR